MSYFNDLFITYKKLANGKKLTLKEKKIVEECKKIQKSQEKRRKNK